MFSITPKDIKTWSVVGPRPTFGLVVTELAKTVNNLMVVTADVSTSAGLDRFRQTYPSKYVDVGIAEQNMIGVAAGLSDSGYVVFTTTFAPFQTLRCLEQIKVNLSYAGTKVIMVGLASGLVNGPLGSTHCCIEDVGALRSLPKIQILSPADGVGLYKAIALALDSTDSVYIRLTGGANNPIVYDSDRNFEIGKGIQLREGGDLTIFATGSMVYKCLRAAEILDQEGVRSSVWDMHTIKPLDTFAVQAAVKKKKLIVTVEEHNVIGGLGSSVAETLSGIEETPKHLALGVNDLYLKPGSYQYMLEQCNLVPEGIAKSILTTLP